MQLAPPRWKARAATENLHCLSETYPTSSRCIGGFNQRQGEALPPQIFLTLKFVVWAE